MLDTQKGKKIFECNVCGDVLETGEGDFDAAKEKFDEEGWKAENVRGVWEHYCPACRKG